jgi:hypothetical protein
LTLLGAPTEHTAKINTPECQRLPSLDVPKAGGGRGPLAGASFSTHVRVEHEIGFNALVSGGFFHE